MSEATDNETETLVEGKDEETNLMVDPDMPAGVEDGTVLKSKVQDEAGKASIVRETVVQETQLEPVVDEDGLPVLDENGNETQKEIQTWHKEAGA